MSSSSLSRGLRAWVAVFCVAVVAPAAVGRADPVPVRVVFEFRDDVARGQYLEAQRPAVEREVSDRIAVACKEQFRYWSFVGAGAADPAAPPSAAAPVLRVWLRRDVKWEVCATLEGPPLGESVEWPVTLYEPSHLDLHGLPAPEVFPREIVDKFKFDPRGRETLLKKHHADIRAVLRTYVPIVRGGQYRYAGPVPLQRPDDAMAVLPLDLSRSEFRELARSKFRIEGVADGADVTVYVLGRRAPAAPVRAAATQPATTQPPATQPAATQPAATQPAATQPAANQPAAGLWVRLAEWHEGGGGARALLDAVLGKFTQLECKLIYLAEYLPDGSLPS